MESISMPTVEYLAESLAEFLYRMVYFQGLFRLG
jgi:hypothetical protein